MKTYTIQDIVIKEYTIEAESRQQAMDKIPTSKGDRFFYQSASPNKILIRRAIIK